MQDGRLPKLLSYGYNLWRRRRLVHGPRRLCPTLHLTLPWFQSCVKCNDRSCESNLTGGARQTTARETREQTGCLGNDAQERSPHSNQPLTNQPKGSKSSWSAEPKLTKQTEKQLQAPTRPNVTWQPRKITRQGTLVERQSTNNMCPDH